MTAASRSRASWRVALVSAVSAALIATVPTTQAAAVDTSDPAPRRLAHHFVSAVIERLDVMPSVAYTKYRLGIPVNDPVREAAAEQAFVDAARDRDIPTPLARRVILAQFTAAKQVQRRLILQWNEGRRTVPTRQPADLTSRLRPRIDAATQRLLDVLADYSAVRPLPGWNHALTEAQQRADPSLRSALIPRNVRTAVAGVARR